MSVSDHPSGPTTHDMATLKFDYSPSCRVLRKINSGRDLGTGIYALFYDGRLFYIGIFAGTGPSKRGNVIRERWRKHLGGMTLRGRNVTICNTDVQRISARNDRGQLGQAILNATRAVMIKDKGLQTTYCKYKFANEHWEAFEWFNAATLKRFQFAFVRCNPEHAFGQLSKPTLKAALESIEHKLVVALEPPCNKRARNESGIPNHTIPEVARRIRMEMIDHASKVSTLQKKIPT